MGKTFENARSQEKFKFEKKKPSFENLILSRNKCESFVRMKNSKVRANNFHIPHSNFSFYLNVLYLKSSDQVKKAHKNLNLRMRYKSEIQAFKFQFFYKNTDKGLKLDRNFCR
jgi:hypothetical protein